MSTYTDIHITGEQIEVFMRLSYALIVAQNNARAEIIDSMAKSHPEAEEDWRSVGEPIDNLVLDALDTMPEGQAPPTIEEIQFGLDLLKVQHWAEDGDNSELDNEDDLQAYMESSWDWSPERTKKAVWAYRYYTAMGAIVQGNKALTELEAS